MNRRPIAMAALLVTFVLAGCGVRPSEVISGGPAPANTISGVRLYLISDGQPTLVARALKPLQQPADIVDLLAAGPTATERDAGFTSEVPAGIAPAKVSNDGTTTSVGLSTDVATLSVLAVNQIVCTVQASVADGPVTLVSVAHRRGPLTCPTYP
ncbi:hypothetical protein DFJ67_3394 [Asanoa ferruginea]|uniref:GerMN domain-containing protein n=1 Tax=Asanoa ferruginea TaxID=53367 RepID=A0A3D9ZIY7_9ACTN|nr:hypothetical protein [Asanoa ferruginea]REF97396.1 hypothetical protein DFJ67_3394 [Asanoa ferruginea]GIF48320.1 hypothetical protein Afe04nite_28590 [Asanoa ferruginea]